MSESFAQLVETQRKLFNSGITRAVPFRKELLKRLEKCILSHEAEILEALHTDLGKSDFEAFTTEILLVLGEIRLMRRSLARWSRPRRVFPGLFNMPGSARVFREPHGVTLILSPWNYPFQLAVMPLAGALAAGNTVILKPSAYAPAVSALMARLFNTEFAPGILRVVEGGRTVNTGLLEQHFDHIFFTGSTTVGRLIMEKASRYLTPVTLELGGKSPCIIDKTADIDLAAKRIIWGKLINSGQTCVAPDYVLVHSAVRKRFIAAARLWINRYYGDLPHKNQAYPHIINRTHFDRLSALIETEKETIVAGGITDSVTMKIAPTLFDGVAWESPLMQEELFGPLLPIIEWDVEADIRDRILSRPRPLALYVFSRDKERIRRLTQSIPFGGGCVNDTIMHVASHSLPFGGTGESGMGSYHGRRSFETFSREKPVLSKPALFDLPLRYPPFEGVYRRFRRFL